MKINGHQQPSQSLFLLICPITKMTSTTSSINTTVFGEGSFFALNANNTIFESISTKQRVSSIKDLNLSQEPSHVWCECRNLNDTPKKLQGVVIAFSTLKTPNKFNIGVIIDMNFKSCVLAYHDVQHGAQTTNSTIFTNLACFDMRTDVSKIHYLNIIHGEYNELHSGARVIYPSRCNIDKKFQCKLKPDVILGFHQFPNSWKLLKIKPQTHPCHSRNDNEYPSKKIRIENLPQDNENTPYVIMKQIKCQTELTTPDCNGYFYIPYVKETNTINIFEIREMPGFQKFALLSLENVKILLMKRSQSIRDHNHMLENLSFKNVLLDVYSPSSSRRPIVFSVTKKIKIIMKLINKLIQLKCRDGRP